MTVLYNFNFKLLVTNLLLKNFRFACDRKDYVNEKFQWRHLELNQQPYDL